MSDQIGQLCEVVGLLIDQTEAMQKDLADLRHEVMDNIIGGIKGLYDENLRVEKVGGLKEKYGDLFKDAEEPYGALTKGSLWEDLMDELEGVADEDVDGKVKELAADLLDRIKAVKGGDEEEAPPDVKVEVEAPAKEPEAEEEDPLDRVRKTVAGMKGMPGMRGE